MSESKIAVIGTGYVGLTTGACLSTLGHHVTCVDIDADKIARLEDGQIPIIEHRLDEIVAEGQRSGCLGFTTDAQSAVSPADVVFLCLPTPQDEDGSADLSYVEAAARQIGPMLQTGAVVVNKSTVPVGAIHTVGDALGRPDVHVVSNPEFLREGTAVDDFLNPDRVVVGADDQAAGDLVASLYDKLDTEIVRTDPASAEVIKYAANGFLATKISFVNSVAALCELVGADVAQVIEGVGSDRRIGRQFLQPGPGWGGSCFPKDSRALVAIGAQHGYDFALMRGAIDVNEQQFERMLFKVTKALDRFTHDRLTGKTVGAFGLTFKAATDDLRESPALRILDRLLERGARVQAYDPSTCGELNATQSARLADYELCTSPLEAAKGADVLVVLTEWPEFRDVDLEGVAELMSGTTIVDCRNLLDPALVRKAGLAYEGVGRR